MGASDDLPHRDKATTAAEGFPPRAPRQRRCRRHFPDVRKAAGAQFISLLGGTRFSLQILIAGTASVSTPERDEQDARYDRYLPPKKEQAADAELWITSRWQQHQRGQCKSREAKGGVACHCSTFRGARRS